MARTGVTQNRMMQRIHDSRASAASIIPAALYLRRTQGAKGINFRMESRKFVGSIRQKLPYPSPPSPSPPSGEKSGEGGATRRLVKGIFRRPISRFTMRLLASSTAVGFEDYSEPVSLR